MNSNDVMVSSYCYILKTNPLTGCAPSPITTSAGNLNVAVVELLAAQIMEINPRMEPERALELEKSNSRK